MIDVYMWTTSNSRRASVVLEEAGLEYTAHPINLRKNEQKSPEHTARNPYQKIPVIVDSDGPGGKPVTVFESGAILLYAAEKSGKLYGRDAADRVEVQKWLMLHVSGSLPILGALRNHPTMRDDAARICKVIDGHLADHRFFAEEFSIADIAFFPRVAGFNPDLFPVLECKNIARWIDEVGARPAIKRGMAQPKV
jgi:GST-like protein